MGTIAAHKPAGSVNDGIQHVAARLRVAGDDRARAFLLRDSLIEIDEELRAAKKPTCTEEEFEGYVWKKEKKGLIGNKEEPVKKDDHGMDAMRMLVYYRDKQYSSGVFV